MGRNLRRSLRCGSNLLESNRSSHKEEAWGGVKHVAIYEGWAEACWSRIDPLKGGVVCLHRLSCLKDCKIVLDNIKLNGQQTRKG